MEPEIIESVDAFGAENGAKLVAEHDGSRVEVDAAAPSEREEVTADMKLIDRFTREMRIPGWAENDYLNLSKDRDYVVKEGFAEGQDQIGCNFVLRCIYTKHAMIQPDDPSFACTAPRMLNPSLMDALAPVAPQLKAERAISEAHAETAAALVTQLFKEADGASQFSTAGLDALTVGVAFLKVTWQEDPARDPAGNHRINDDIQDQMQRLRRLSYEFASGLFGGDDPRVAQLNDLTRYAVNVAKASMDERPELAGLATHDPAMGPPSPALLPEPEVWQGARIDLVMPENLRLDWSRVATLDQMYQSRRIIERVWMHPDEIAERYSLTIEDKARLGGGDWRGTDVATATAGHQEAVSPLTFGLEATKRGDEVAFYECWDRETRTLYQWAAGLPKFLNRETPSVVSRRFYPYVAVGFNYASGKLLPLSEVRIVRPLQDEINQRLTGQRDHMRARHPRYIAEKGALTAEEKQKIRNSEPHDVIEITGSVDDVMKKIAPLLGAPFNPSDYDVSMLMRLIEVQMGTPASALGQSRGANLATEVEIANDQMQAQSGRHGQRLVRAIGIAGEMILDYASAAMTAEQVKKLLGPTAVWPQRNREQIARGLMMTMSAQGSDRAARRQGLESLTQASTALQNLFAARSAAAAVGKKLEIEEMAGKILADCGITKPVQDILSDLEPVAPPPQPGLPQDAMPQVAA